MLRCLRRCRSVAMSSSWLMVRPSRTFTSIRTYGRMREFTKVDSSSTKPSGFNVRCSPIAGNAFTQQDSTTAAAPKESALDDSAVSWLDCSTGVGGVVSLDAAWPALMRAAMLSCFFFALPESVSRYFLLRSLPHCRRRCARQPKGQRRLSRFALRGCAKKRIPQWQHRTAQPCKSGRPRKAASSVS